MQYIIYCDESVKRGKYYSNFYGGALVRSKNFEQVRNALEAKKSELNLGAEVKWQKVTSNYLEKYLELIQLFFYYVKQDKIKVRIMFTHNRFLATNLTKEQRDQEYFLLYYQFFKHAFGFQYSNSSGKEISLYTFFDQLPDTKEKNNRFKDFIFNLQNLEPFESANLIIHNGNDIAEARSHDHIILQCLDVVLGAMEFRLNDKHKEIPEGKTRRGKRTIAKEKLYKAIHREINSIYKGFNIGESTGRRGNDANLWIHSYRHWKFTPLNRMVNEDYLPKNK